MSRTQKSYTIVSIEDNHIETSHYANAEALKSALALYPSERQVVVFEGDVVEFTVDNTPRITLGAKRERKPRGPNKKKAKNGSVGPTITQVEHQHVKA